MDEVLQRYYKRITIGVSAVVTNTARQILFVAQLRGPFADYWLVPGGTIEPGEEASNAVIREIQEETGITIVDPQFLALYNIRGHWSGGAYHIMLMGFRAETDSDLPSDFQGDHVGGAKWARPDELRIHSTQLQILNDAGVATYDPEYIVEMLARDGVTMTKYSTAHRVETR